MVMIFWGKASLPAVLPVLLSFENIAFVSP